MLQHMISTALLGPLLLLQGRHVRSNIQLLPEPEGSRSGIAGSGKPLRLLIVGDSAAAGVGALTQESSLLGSTVAALAGDFEVHYKLLARTGDNTRDCNNRLQAEEPFQADVVLTSLGVNDVTSGCLEWAFVKRQQYLTQLLRSRFAAQQIILSGLPPVSHFPALPQPLRWYLGAQAKRFDRQLERLAGELDLDYIQFDFEGDTSVMASDKFHPGPPVYKFWGEAAADKIRARF